MLKNKTTKKGKSLIGESDNGISTNDSVNKCLEKIEKCKNDFETVSSKWRNYIENPTDYIKREDFLDFEDGEYMVMENMLFKTPLFNSLANVLDIILNNPKERIEIIEPVGNEAKNFVMEKVEFIDIKKEVFDEFIRKNYEVYDTLVSSLRRDMPGNANKLVTTTIDKLQELGEDFFADMFYLLDCYFGYYTTYADLYSLFENRRTDKKQVCENKKRLNKKAGRALNERKSYPVYESFEVENLFVTKNKNGLYEGVFEIFLNNQDGSFDYTKANFFTEGKDLSTMMFDVDFPPKTLKNIKNFIIEKVKREC